MTELTDKKNKIFDIFFKIYFRNSLKRNFFSINIRGKELLEKIKSISQEQNSPVIICVNHSNWWDGVLLNWVSHYLIGKESYCLMDTTDLNRHSYFNKIGALPLERKNKFNSYRTLKYCSKLLGNKNRFLWIFPQGELIPNERKPYKFYNGVSLISEDMDRLHILCVYFGYKFTLHQRPEIYIDFFKSFEKEDINRKSRKEFTMDLENIFNDQSEIFSESFAKNDLKDFEIILKGKKSVNEREITRTKQI